MDPPDLTGKAGLPEDAASVVADYLSQLDGLLPLPGGERGRIVAEAADTLVSETVARIDASQHPGAAARAAVAAFGDPAMLAKQFAEALAPGAARRVGLLLIGSGPMVGLCWVAAIGSGAGWVARVSSTFSALPLVPVILAFSGPAAVLAVLAGSNLLRPSVFAGVGPRAARLAAFGCVCADALLIGTAATQLASGRLGLGGWLAFAAGLSVLRLSVAAIAVRRLARLIAVGC